MIRGVTRWVPGTVMLWIAVFAVPTGSQTAYKPARTADGHPDFTGIWETRGTTNWNLEGHAGGPGVPASKSVVVDPPDGKIPYKPEARAKRNAMKIADDPQAKCYLSGVPRVHYTPGPFQILQNAAMTAIIYQDQHTYRLIPYDREPTEGYEFWLGSSQGRWEGDTLIVQTINFTGKTWFDKAGNFHTPDLRVLERYSLIGPNTLQYEARIEDANVFTRPWTIRLTAERHTEPGFRIREDNCLIEGGKVYHTVPHRY